MPDIHVERLNLSKFATSVPVRCPELRRRQCCQRCTMLVFLSWRKTPILPPTATRNPEDRLNSTFWAIHEDENRPDLASLQGAQPGPPRLDQPPHAQFEIPATSSRVQDQTNSHSAAPELPNLDKDHETC